MALLTTLHGAILPFLLLFTIPLSIIACLTTFLAFNVLVCRVIFVYVDFALATIPKYLKELASGGRPREYPELTPSPTRHSHTNLSRIDTSKAAIISAGPVFSPYGDDATPESSTQPGKNHRRRRTGSLSSQTGNISPTYTHTHLPGHKRDGTLTPRTSERLGLVPSVGPTRDYEGIGGWRLGRGSSSSLEGEEDEEAWTKINSRLELPALSPEVGRRRHYRTHSGESANGDGGLYIGGGLRGRNDSPEGLRMTSSIGGRGALASPNTAKVRTPTRGSRPPGMTALGKEEADEYFPKIISPQSRRVWA